MTSSSAATGSAPSSQQSQIHTAGCIIIGDEVLGGKVSQFRSLPWVLPLAPLPPWTEKKPKSNRDGHNSNHIGILMLQSL